MTSLVQIPPLTFKLVLPVSRHSPISHALVIIVISSRQIRVYGTKISVHNFVSGILKIFQIFDRSQIVIFKKDLGRLRRSGGGAEIGHLKVGGVRSDTRGVVCAHSSLVGLQVTFQALRGPVFFSAEADVLFGLTGQNVCAGICRKQLLFSFKYTTHCSFHK